MVEGIDNQYIGNAIEELVDLLSVKEDILINGLLEKLQSKKVKECIESMAHYIGLPIGVNICYDNKFETTALSKTSISGQGTQGITAQVSIPSNLPLYGSPDLKNFQINVKVGENYQKSPYTFMAIMAHELTHVLLHSLWFKEKNNEIYTDLAAMIIGFKSIMITGRKHLETVTNTLTNTTMLGYLSDDQFLFAFNKLSIISAEIDKLKIDIFKKVVKHKKLLSSYVKQYLKFKNLLEYLDKNHERKIKKEDSSRIVVFHQPDYIDKFISVINNNKKILKKFEIQKKLDSLRKFNSEIEIIISNLKNEFDMISDDVNILKKYVGIFDRFRINHNLRTMI